MKKSILGLVILFILLTTYTPKFNFIINSNLHIQKIKIENNSIIKSDKIKEKLSFLYREQLLLYLLSFATEILLINFLLLQKIFFLTNL